MRYFVIVLSMPNTISVMKSNERTKQEGHVACKEGIKMHIKFVRKPEGKQSLGRPNHRWDDNVRMDA
jgi:hypothetical protein